MHVSYLGGSPVWEYPVGDQWIMMDTDDGYVLWTAIWKGMFVLACMNSPISPVAHLQHLETPKVHAFPTTSLLFLNDSGGPTQSS
jgi:hypothetical protein